MYDLSFKHKSNLYITVQPPTPPASLPASGLHRRHLQWRWHHPQAEPQHGRGKAHQGRRGPTAAVGSEPEFRRRRGLGPDPQDLGLPRVFLAGDGRARVGPARAAVGEEGEEPELARVRRCRGESRNLVVVRGPRSRRGQAVFQEGLQEAIGVNGE